MGRNPFGDEPVGGKRINPFGEEPDAQSPAEAATRIEQAATKIRGLRMQMGAEGLTLPGTRALIDEVAAALDAAAKALRTLGER